MKYSIFLFLSVMFAVCTPSNAEISQKLEKISPPVKTFTITDFGITPDSGKDAGPAVQRALVACRKAGHARLVFPKGRYDFYAPDAIRRDYYESNTTDNNPKCLGVLIENFNWLTLDGSGSDFVFHGRMQPITIERSRNVTIQNVRIDWDIPLTAQSKVVAVNDDWIDIRINTKESPYVIDKNGKLIFQGEGWTSGWWGTMEFEADSRRIPYRSGDGCLGGGWNKYRAEEIEPGLVRLHYRFRRHPAVGNTLVMRTNQRDHAGIFVLHSFNTELRQIELFHCAGLGVLAQYADTLTLDRCHVRPNREKERFFSGHDDGLQVSNCRGLIKVHGCEFAGLMDDPINVHGTSVRIVKKISADTLRCRFMHKQSVGMEWGHPGDRIGYIENTCMEFLGEATIKSWTLLNSRNFEVTFKTPVPDTVTVGDALENLTWTPDVDIRDCIFGPCRARGLLISTPGKVVIAGNDFESSGSAILINGDANGWYESGAVRDVLIKNNTFQDACLTSTYQFCNGVISILPIIPKLDIEKPFHRNIRIVDNTFQVFDYSLLYSKSVDGLMFARNKIIHSKRYKPFNKQKYGLTLDACKNVTVEDNTFEGDVPGRTIKLNRMSRDQLKLGVGGDKWTIVPSP